MKTWVKNGEHTGKFKSYMKLNFLMIKKYYGLILASSLLSIFFPWCSAAGACLFISAARLLYSRSLYEKDAYLFQSVPVRENEIVITKTLLGAAGVFMVLGSMSLSGILMSGILETASIVFMSLAVSGAVLFSVSLGNRMRNSRDRKPKSVMVVFLLAALGGAVYGLDQLIAYLDFLSPLQKNILSIILSLSGAVAFYFLNIRMMKKYYCV